MAGLFSRLFTPSARPETGEVAGAGIGILMAPYIGELPLHPDRGARYASGVRDEVDALQIYRQTLRDERCRAALDQRLDAVVSKAWEVEPGGEDDVDRAAAESLDEQLRRIDFERASRQLLHGVWYGYSIAEAIWTQEESRVALEDLCVRAPDRFRWTAEGAPLLRTYANLYGEELPPAKFVLLARPGEHGDLPYSPGLARWCYWPVWLKRHGMKFWAIALEKFGAPTAKGKYPKSATPDEKDELLDLVTDLATGVGVVVPEGQDIEILETVRTSGGDFEQFVGYLDRMITTTILGQSSTTDQGPWRGTAEVQKDVRDETIASDGRLLDTTLNNTIARWLTHWNFPSAATPVIRHDVDPPEDLDARAKREHMIARTAGLRPTRGHVEAVYGGEWEDAPVPPPMPRGGDPAADPPEGDLAGPHRRTGAIDVAIETLLAGDGWEPLMEPVIEPVLAEASAALARGDSLEELRDGLPALFARMDDTVLVQTLRRMGFSARLSGDAGLSDDETGGVA